ncbi:MAG TPA: replication-relaxation family protein [Myxococcaceae bacterium]|nr:replication-relaxation family protein [Myxococcaceae bacterium]
MERGSEEEWEAGKAKAAARSGEGGPAERGTNAAAPGAAGRRLGAKDRELISLLGVCRYLTVGQLVRLGRWAATVKAMQYRLRGLSGEGTTYKVRPFNPPMLRQLVFRAFDGELQQLWTLTTAGYAVAGAELGRPLRVPRTDVGAAFAEHFVLLTDLFVDLVRPYLQAGIALGGLPFRWDVVEQVELPWREGGVSGEKRTRVVRPDAVVEMPAAHRRFFIECETGSHTLVPRSPEKHQATLRKLERYDDYVCGLADASAGLSHYHLAHPEGWPCELLFVVPTGSRQQSTASVVGAFRASRNARCVAAQALALPEATAYLRQFLRPPAAETSSTGSRVASRPASSRFYGEVDHRAVKTFVLEMSAALQEANAALRRCQLPLVSEPPSGVGMVAFLRRAQAEMLRRRESASNA